MSAPLKIEIVEDEEPIRRLYSLKLSLEGYNIQTASDGEEGLVVAERFHPDIILLDLKMPKMNGAEMLKKMRSMPWGSSPIVVILTNISRDEAPHNLRFLGVSKYIVKAHHTPSQIVDIIKKLTETIDIQNRSFREQS